MTQEELAGWLLSLPREKSAEEVERIEEARDRAHGEYVNRNLSVHHYGEAEH